MKKIKEYRLRANMSQGQLAEKLNVKQPSVSQWERGTANPGIETAKKLSEVLNIPFGLIFDQYSSDGPVDVPVYSRVQGNGSFLPCSRADCLLKVPEEELRMLLPKSEVIDRGLAANPKVRIDTDWFFGYFCESTAMAPLIQPNSLNLIYRTKKIFSNAVHLVSIDGRDASLVKLIQNERGVLVIIKGNAERYRHFRNCEIHSGTLRVYGVVVESRKMFIY